MALAGKKTELDKLDVADSRAPSAKIVREQVAIAIEALASLPPADEIAQAFEGNEAPAATERIDEALLWLTAFAWELKLREH